MVTCRELSSAHSAIYSLHLLFFNAPAPTEIYTLSLHDALPIPRPDCNGARVTSRASSTSRRTTPSVSRDRKSTRLNSSHQISSYAVFCLKKKNARRRWPAPGLNCARCFRRGQVTHTLAPHAYLQ